MARVSARLRNVRLVRFHFCPMSIQPFSCRNGIRHWGMGGILSAWSTVRSSLCFLHFCIPRGLVVGIPFSHPGGSGSILGVGNLLSHVHSTGLVTVMASGTVDGRHSVRLVNGSVLAAFPSFLHPTWFSGWDTFLSPRRLGFNCGCGKPFVPCPFNRFSCRNGIRHWGMGGILSAWSTVRSSLCFLHFCIPRGLVVGIPFSHPGGSGSIPGVGNLLSHVHSTGSVAVMASGTGTWTGVLFVTINR
ncbi:hypothetical protein AVEN_34444-1 [Araneus ventricosus]|uniref:Uncharacterized protein n=1 Tax=Araneus ventricosus TaxID=182803 RepID=A0A4Y2X371_ARAVE|nr:hypothetical protein AVEN_34444-1 [Araneus ventricosus]